VALTTGPDEWWLERPFADVDDLLGKAEHVWCRLMLRIGWLPFAVIRRIGEQKAAEKVTEQARKMVGTRTVRNT